MRYIKDEEFIRGNCPMTKEEIRILAVSKMEIEENHKILDVGAGTGSISIQASKICSKGKVVSIEKEEKAVNVFKKNIEKFNAKNIEMIIGDASKIIEDLNHEFDSIFIGGSGGNLEKIIKDSAARLKFGGNLVLNFITINNVYKAVETLKEIGFVPECMQVAVSKTIKNTYMLKANNPIFIVNAKKTKENV